VETIEDVAAKVIDDLGYEGDLSSLSDDESSTGSSEFENVRSELVDAVEINVAAPAPEDSEKFTEVAFTPNRWGHTSFNGDNYYLGIFTTSTGRNDPGLYEMLEGNGPVQGVPSRTPPSPDAGGPPPDAQWTEGGWFGEFEQNIWASITESEGNTPCSFRMDLRGKAIGRKMEQTRYDGRSVTCPSRRFRTPPPSPGSPLPAAPQPSPCRPAPVF